MALAVLCRVFNDGGDTLMDRWREWYDPSEWLHYSRALGVFIWTVLGERGFPRHNRRRTDVKA